MTALRLAARWRLIVLPVLLIFACIGAHAQANSSIIGIVTDQTGAVVEGANVAVTEQATGSVKTTVSSGTGLYEIAGLNAGSYNLKVTAKGFETYAQTGVVVNISATFRVDVKLTVGADTTTVTVQADALTVQADSNVVSTLINEQQITDLATNGRNVVALAALGLGVSGNLPDTNVPTSVGSSQAISFNGLNQGHNIWLIDGGEAYDRGSGGKTSTMPSQDALGEFQIMSSNYPPDYGISSGGTISMSVKSGTNKFHGELWEFARNDAFNAFNYFKPSNGIKPEMRYNIFGGNLGGPVPGLHKKTFFFYNEEWRKIVTGSAPSATNAVPAGDFVTSAANFTWVKPTFSNVAVVKVPTASPNSRLGAAIAADGLTPGSPFPNNAIPGNLLDPVALQFNSVGGIPQATSASNDAYLVSAKQPVQVREDLFRIDHNINDKWSLFGHYIHDSVSQVYATSTWSGDSYPTVGSNFSNPSNSVVIKLTGSLSPNVLLEAAIDWDGNNISITPQGTAWQKPSGWNGVSFFPQSGDADNRLPSVQLGTSSDPSAWGTTFDPWSQPWVNAAQDENENFAFSVTHSKHALKFGGGYNRYTKKQQLFGNTNGYFNFGDQNPLGTGDAYLNFLLGAADSYSELQTQDVRHYVNQTISFFAMDNWHVNNRLSLQYGVRFDALPHAWERNNRLASFDPSQYQAGLAPQLDTQTGAFCTAAIGVTPGGCNGTDSPGLVNIEGGTFYLNGVTMAGVGGTPRGLTKNDYNTVQPRVGFSYDLTGNGKTVLRGGFGTFFERVQGNDVYNVATAAPFSNTPGLSNVTFANPFASWQTGVALSSTQLPVVPQGPTTIAPVYKAPGVAMYSLGVQREIQPSLVLVTQYVGNIAWHQIIEQPINPFPLSTPLATRKSYATGGLTTYQADLARTFPGFTGITEETTVATGSYNSLQVGLRQQDRHGLTFEVDYTYSHEIDSQVGSADLNASQSNPFNVKYDKGSGNLDRRHILNINYVYKMPFFNHSSGIERTALGGWTLSGTVISETGLPWAGNNAPSYGGSDTVGLGGNYTIRPQVVGKLHYPKTVRTYQTTTGYQWISNDNLGTFAAPVAAWNGGTNLGFGDAGRDIVAGPGRTNFVTSLYKSFAFGERAHFEFRAESFNTFNHTQFNGFNSNSQASNFGFTTSAQDPRVFEFGGKLVF